MEKNLSPIFAKILAVFDRSIYSTIIGLRLKIRFVDRLVVLKNSVQKSYTILLSTTQKNHQHHKLNLKMFLYNNFNWKSIYL